MKTLTGKTALVTGSTSGIGLGVALELARQGANIVLNGFGEVAQASERVSAEAVALRYHDADLGKPEQIAAMMAYVQAEFGGLDILVNNAGIQHIAKIEDFAPEKWDAILAINLSAAFHTSRLAIPAMRARGWGRIINIASAHGLVGSTGKSAYVAAKHGLIGLTKVAALELAETDITCNAICPGWVRTPLVEKQIEARAQAEGIATAQAQRALLAEKQPSHEFVTPEQIGQLVLFLCSPAASQVRGVAWSIDGGWTAQ
ncbi:3-hydroxybutyrate dehydrogenase [Chitinimonas arctica]|uniref:3-hydroxybutyrate dehydrogenase n=1 Tax=Chitinimonas arctica TaxID=2594795 RepID=A0A516SIQ1_9NEIS|nr:3-hydroxybutyrate dehydrogenase [Chitinimonas arctica]QDQ28026.1 3-hydroxybutyrate dehydrogenase [Chitinimonas arctica]